MSIPCACFLTAIVTLTIAAASYGGITTDAVDRPNPEWIARHAEINERVKRGNVDLIFVGDLITEGAAPSC